jgi:hypothetical protein
LFIKIIYVCPQLGSVDAHQTRRVSISDGAHLAQLGSVDARQARRARITRRECTKAYMT